jgi:hypothetical protein
MTQTNTPQANKSPRNFLSPPRVDVGPYDYHPEGMAPEPDQPINRAQGEQA